LPLLPISEYPEVVPPSVQVRASFPGASPKVVAETVATPLEEQINGVENMLYMSSQATTNGSLALTVTFKLGTDPDLAQQLVQNRINQALPRLPDIVRQLGVNAVKSSSELTMVVHITSPNDQHDSNYLRNYATLNIKDRLTRLPGVGNVSQFGGGDYALRIWLNPGKLSARGLTPQDVVAAVREQNVQAAAGTLAAQPSQGEIAFELPITAQGRLASVEEFENIIVKTDGTGGTVFLKDVARVELGANQYSLRSQLNGKQAAALAIFQAPGSNALAISDAVRQTMAELKPSFPAGVDYDIIYDPTQFVRTSIEKVIHTLVEALLLVVLVVIVFLQTWRASIIPLLAVPVSIVGTFAVMYLLGFSINNLTLFGLVLAIGIVVDDAIVVVENVERNIAKGLSAHDATVIAMQEVSGPIIAIALTLCAVFIPLAFIAGLTGQFYQQFAVTIAISTVISAFNSLTLSPALAAMLLQPHGAKPDWLTRQINRVFGRFFAWFNRVFTRSGERYEANVASLFKRKALGLGAYVAIILLAFGLFKVTPSGYVPTQDKQYLVAFAQLPAGSSLDRTQKVMDTMTAIALQTPGVQNAIAFPGLSIAGFSNSSNAGIVFMGLQPFAERKTWDLYGPAIAGKLMGQLNGAIPEAFVGVFPPPPVSGLGTIGGFKLQLQDRADLGDAALYQATQAVIGRAYQTKELAGIFSSFEINVPQLYANLNREKAKQLGVNIDDVFATMQIALGSFYINDFNKFGRTYQVIAQADAPFRAQVDDILNLKVKSRTTGQLIPLGSLMNVENSFGPDRAIRYNLFRAADINAGPAPGFSSGQAQAAMEKILAETLPAGIGYEYTDLAYQQIISGNTEVYIFALCILLVFLVLAAQYESLVLPVAIILIVPVVLLCGLFGVWITGGDNNIFTQIGLIVLVGLACKNAILIVEFARELELAGKGIVESALEACRLRLRPILMTSFAFIMGVVPLVFSSGAGMEMRQAIGITVFSGMVGVTFLGLFFTPLFYVVLRYLSGGKPMHSASACTLQHAELEELKKPTKGKSKEGKSHA
ncbi:MAG: efflux RND transporter permease subunit, partial [Proteobacteria bacterium]|nr:efflux RND transporter permease subunit [Pseudomonadota bacterium]